MTASIVTGVATLNPGSGSIFDFLTPYTVRDLGAPNTWLSWAETVNVADSGKFRINRLSLDDPRPRFWNAGPSSHEAVLGCGHLRFNYTLIGDDPVDVRFGFVFGSSLDDVDVVYVYDPTIVVE